MANIHSSSVLERSVLKEGQLFLVADRGGDIKPLNLEGQGLYYRDMRHLSLFEMDIMGTRLTLLGSAGELNFMSTLQFANDTLLGPSGAVIAEPRTISIRRNRFLHDRLHERLGLVNYNPHPVELVVRFTFGSDFRDMFEVRGYYSDGHERGEVRPIEVLDDGVQLAYSGEDGVERRTRVTFDPEPHHVEILNDRLRKLGQAEALPGLGQWTDPREEGRVIPPIAAAVFHIALPPMQARSVTITITPEASDAPRRVRLAPSPESDAERGRALDHAFVGIRDSYEAWRSASTHIETDHELFDQLLRRALRDLRLLVDDVEGDLVPTAGIPWFAVPFGRDSLITAVQTLCLQPAIAAGTLRFLARHQGTEVNDFRDEAPGKILHEVRTGELAKLRKVPHSPYYGSVDSTPLFLVTLGEYVTWTGDLDLARQLLPNAEAGLAWMDQYGDVDGDGFLEFQTRSSEGMRNQGWKDSPDSATHRDGHLAEPPIALAEVQAYRYAAHREMAHLYARLGQAAREREQRAAAERVRAQFLERLPLADADGPFWAMGLDGAKQPIETITSNPGHALWCGLLRGDEARAATERLLKDDMLCGWGLRTLSSKARSFNPMSYHNGSVWPHDNALIALGMKRAGCDAAAREVASQVFEAGLRFPGSRLPELWCGFARDQRYQSTPAQYPVSCSPQAWAAGSAFMLLQALLGLEADAFERVVRLRPLLPTWLGRISLRKLRVAGSQVDLDVVRQGHRTMVDIIDDGGLRFDLRTAKEP